MATDVLISIPLADARKKLGLAPTGEPLTRSEQAELKLLGYRVAAAKAAAEDEEPAFNTRRLRETVVAAQQAERAGGLAQYPDVLGERVRRDVEGARSPASRAAARAEQVLGRDAGERVRALYERATPSERAQMLGPASEQAPSARPSSRRAPSDPLAGMRPSAFTRAVLDAVPPTQRPPSVRPDIAAAVDAELARAPSRRELPPPVAVLDAPRAPAPSTRRSRVLESTQARVPSRQVPARPGSSPWLSRRQACARQTALEAIALADGNKSKAARSLGISREGLYAALNDSPYYQARRAAGRS